MTCNEGEKHLLVILTALVTSALITGRLICPEMEVFTLAPFSCLSHVAHFQELSNSFILEYTIFVIFMALLQILSFSSGLAIQETSKNSSCPGSIVFQAIWLSLSFITAIIPHDTSRSHQKQPSDYMNFPEPELPIIQSELASA